MAPEFTRFGLPPLPLMMRWSLMKSTMHFVSFESFRLNTGKLPQLVMVHLRKFLTFDPTNQDADAAEAVMLRHPEPSTPFAVTMRYYGELANPLENLATAGCMQEWWTAMRNHIAQLRSTNAITPTAAMGMYARYLASCVESHRGMILSGAYRSTRIQQALHIVERMPSSPLHAAEMRPVISRMTTRVPESIRHDTYMRASCIFMNLFEDINRDFVLNSGNLECMMEMLVSSLSWLVGSHNTTFKWFFQVRDAVFFFFLRGVLAHPARA
jgi:hypothetical protein